MIKQTLLAALLAFSVTSANAMTLGETAYVVTDINNSMYFLRADIIIGEDVVRGGYWQDSSKDKTVVHRSKTVLQEYNCTDRTKHTLVIRTTYPNGRMTTTDVSDVGDFVKVSPNSIGEALLEAACSVLKTY